MTPEKAQRYKHFKSHTGYLQATQMFLLQNTEAFKLDKAKTMISIGAGCGELDEFVVNKCTSNLEHYIGVEPDKTSFEILSSTMLQKPTLKVSLINESVPEWKGPEEQVDIVLLSHVLYYVSDQMAAVKQCYGWVKPGGSLIILHSYAENAYTEIARGLNFQVKSYTYKKLKDDMIKDGLTDFEEKNMTYDIYSEYQDDETVKAYFRNYIGDILDEEVANLTKIFKKRCEESGYNIATIDGCIRLEKPI